VVSKHKLKERASMEKVSIIGVDLAKNVDASGNPLALVSLS
jgi:hypothetical protein